jgi:hypothetical protein
LNPIKDRAVITPSKSKAVVMVGVHVLDGQAPFAQVFHHDPLVGLFHVHQQVFGRFQHFSVFGF